MMPRITGSNNDVRLALIQNECERFSGTAPHPVRMRFRVETDQGKTLVDLRSAPVMIIHARSLDHGEFDVRHSGQRVHTRKVVWPHCLPVPKNFHWIPYRSRHVAAGVCKTRCRDMWSTII